METLTYKSSKHVVDMILLQTVFPEELWSQILQRITNVADYKSLCAASSYFINLLLSHRTRILFPEVISHITKFLFWTKDAYPLLLTCRPVCRAWKEGVDSTLQNIPNQWVTNPLEFLMPDHPSLLCNHINWLHIFQQLECQDKFETFLKTFHDSHYLTGANPFPSRSVCILVYVENESSNYCNKLLEVLKNYGHHIWHCTIKLIFRSDDSDQILILLRSTLELLPQLRTLKISQLARNVNTDNLSELLNSNPLPKMKNLQILEERNLLEPIFSSLISKNDHITKLIIHGLDSSRHSEIFLRTLPNLEELHVMQFRSPDAVTEFLNANVTWPLNKLTIFCHPDIPHADEMLNFIETRWADTLKCLQLTIPATVAFSNARVLNLPHLENLKLTIRKYTSMDCILPMSKSLQSLSVRVEGENIYSEELENCSTITFFLHRDNLLESNIWRIFHKLKSIKYCDESLPTYPVVRQYRRCHCNGMEMTNKEFGKKSIVS